jgi:hypothetical protein
MMHPAPEVFNFPVPEVAATLQVGMALRTLLRKIGWRRLRIIAAHRGSMHNLPPPSL